MAIRLALISARGAALQHPLMHAGLLAQPCILQPEPHILPPCEHPLLLFDTVGYDLLRVCRILDALARRPAPLPPTLVLVPPCPAVQQLVIVCPGLTFVFPDGFSLRHLYPAYTLISALVAPVGGFWLGIDRPAPLLHDPDVLALLPALTQATRMAEVAQHLGLSHRTLMRKCQALRQSLCLEHTQRMPPPTFAAAVLQTLASPPQSPLPSTTV